MWCTPIWRWIRFQSCATSYTDKCGFMHERIYALEHTCTKQIHILAHLLVFSVMEEDRRWVAHRHRKQACYHDHLFGFGEIQEV